MLATLASTPFHARAAELAVELAVESAATLMVVNVIDLPVGRMPLRDLGDPAAVARSLRAPAERAAAFGAPVITLRVRSLRPVATLLALVSAHGPAVIVFGPNPAHLSVLRHLSPRQYRRAAAILETRTSCLLWRPGEATSGRSLRRSMPHRRAVPQLDPQR